MIAHSKPYITKKDLDSVKLQLSSGQLAEGAKVSEFEKQVAEYTNTKFCLATSSGVTSLQLALHAVNVKENDEVIIPSYLCHSVYNAIEKLGARPVLCDVGLNWCMAPSEVEKVFTSRTKAIVVVHMFGINAWHEEWKKFNVSIIEDNCQAFGHEQNFQPMPLHGDISFYSFHATKCLATGEGGMLATNNEMYYRVAKKQKEEHNPFCRMTDMQAALGLSQLQQYNWMKQRRKEIAKQYYAKLPQNVLGKAMSINGHSIFFRFPLEVKRGAVDALIRNFNNKDIAVRRGVDELLHRKYGQNDRDFPNAVTCFESTLSIPIYPALTNEEVECVITETNYLFDYGRI